MKPIRTTDSSGTTVWALNGQIHREDGPAVEYPDGSKHWYLNDQLHREDGPAIERANGAKFWFLLGTKVEPFTPAQVPLLLLGLMDL